jgi:hypothetical protein
MQKFKVAILVCVCDSVARPLMQNFKQFNGYFGCSFCMDKGESVEKGNGRVTVYPYNHQSILRNKQNTYEHLLIAAESGTASCGVKGPSVLNLLPHFDMVKGTVPDFMHSICLGTVRQMATLWFDPKNHNQEFYIGKLMPAVDARLSVIKPPSNISRTPRGIAVMRFWKAHEWLVWLLYYSLPVLKGILPIAFYAHWAILVDSRYCNTPWDGGNPNDVSLL